MSSACDFKSHFCKQCGPRSDSDQGPHCLLVCKNRFEKSARIFRRRHKQTTFSDAVFLGALRVKWCRHHILRHLIWVYTVCKCPFYGMLGIHGLKLSLECPHHGDKRGATSNHLHMFTKERRLSPLLVCVRDFCYYSYYVSETFPITHTICQRLSPLLILCVQDFSHYSYYVSEIFPLLILRVRV